MKVIKPQKLGLLSRTFEHKGDTFLSLSMAAFFPLDQAAALLPEVELWKFTGAELGASALLDEGLPKQRGEVLVSGRAYPPGGKAQIACQVRVSLGSVDKTLRVVGNRQWERGGTPSQPEPFTELPLTYAQAFGGAGHAPNPLGKGFAPVQTPKGPVHPLPNVEDPRHPVRTPKDKPAPAGLLPFDVSWPQRLSKAGTYDSQWLKTRFPGFADDLHPTWFNTAPEDQWLTGFPQGGERFVLENLHPSQPRVEGTLPRLAARAFITLRTAKGEEWRELSTRIDTVWLFPHALRGVLLFRALTRIAEDDAADVIHCMAAFEAPEAPRPARHYEEVLARRLDKKQGHLFALRDDELLPQWALAPATEPAPPETGDALRAALERRIDREREKAKEETRKAGIDPDSFIAPPPPPKQSPTLEELPVFIARVDAQVEEQQEAAKRKRAEAEQEARQICAEHGIDFEKMMDDAAKKAGGPPRFSAREELAKLQQLANAYRSEGQPQPELEAMLAVPAFAERLMQGEAKLKETYRRFAHHFPAAARLPADASAQARALVQARISAKQPLAGEDLTGADLTGISLAGADLSGAFLERANLRGVDLRGANLTQTVLARADLSGARLTGACLKETNLGSALLAKAQLDGGVELAGANLSGADLSGANLRGARLANVDLTEARLQGVDFREAVAENTTFLQSDLSGAAFTGATLTGCNFLECKVEGVDFSGASLPSSVFLGAKGDGALFRKAKLGNLRLVQGCSFVKADFQGAELVEANLRGSKLEQSDFSGATLDRADLSECDLRKARFHRAVARESRWVRANLQGANLVSINLMNSILQKADIEGADFTGANLFRVDFARARGKAASVKGALLIEVRLPQREAR